MPLCRFDDEVRLTGDRRETDLRSPMAVRAREPLDRRSGHEERLEDPALDYGHAAGLHPFVVVPVEAGQVRVSQTPQGRVKRDGEAVGEYLFVDLLREGLPFGLTFLAMTLDAMAEHLLEEHGARPSRENGRAGVGLERRRTTERVEIRNDLFDHLGDFAVVRQSFRSTAKSP